MFFFSHGFSTFFCSRPTEQGWATSFKCQKEQKKKVYTCSDVPYSSENISRLRFKLNQNSASKTAVLQKRKSSLLEVKFRDRMVLFFRECLISHLKTLNFPLVGNSPPVAYRDLLTGCSLFKNTHHTLGGFTPQTPRLSLQCWLPH